MNRLTSLLLLLALGGTLAGVPAHAGAEQRFAPRPENGLVLTPPMGWNSWNKFGCNIDEAKVRAQADAMVASGMRDAGYRYIVIDDCWQAARDPATGAILADEKHFPSGIRALSDYVHARGLLFGLYSDAGDHTCQGRPGSRGHEYQDALQYAAWGVDYLKYDWCDADSLEARAAYETMGDALRATGRPIVFSVCEWGIHEPWKWADRIGANLWRTTGDIYDAWEGLAHNGEWHGVLDILDAMVGLEVYAHPGHWNDPDMLEVGNGRMTDGQYRAHFGLWAMWAAPLVAGNDLASMDAPTRAILTNRDVIAIDQDPLGVAAHRAWKQGDAEIWVRPLKDGGRAALMLNRGIVPVTVRLDRALLDMAGEESIALRDLWTGRETRLAGASLFIDLGPTSTVLLRASLPGAR